MTLLWGLVLIPLSASIVKYHNGWYTLVMISPDEVSTLREFTGTHTSMLSMVLQAARLDCRLNVISLLTEAIIIILFRIMWIAYVADFWVYPFLRIMPNSFKAAFFTMSFCILIFFYFLGKWMTTFIWRGKTGLVVLVCSSAGSASFNDTWTLLNQSFFLLSILLAHLLGNRSWPLF